MANILDIELVNMLTEDGSDAANATDLDLQGWDFVLVKEDPADSRRPPATPYFAPGLRPARPDHRPGPAGRQHDRHPAGRARRHDHRAGRRAGGPGASSARARCRT